MKKIELSQGQFTIVDDEDYDVLSSYKWYAAKMGGSFYAVRNNYPTKKLIYLHRFLINPLPKFEIDHINGDPLDNRKSNLRTCLHSQNTKNRKLSRNNTTGHKGIYLEILEKKPIWRANIKVNGKDMALGYFRDKAEAALAYTQAAKKYFGEFVREGEIP